jgi:Ni,Fe-hydrogenase III component G
MNTFSQDIPESQVIFNAHAVSRAKIEIANQAVYDAVMAVWESNDPMAPNIFGADQDMLLQLASTPRRKLLPLLMTGIPIWSLRLATADFKRVLDSGENGDAALRSLLGTFSSPVPLKSLAANFVSTTSSPQDIPVTQASLNIHASSRAKIEVANRAVVDGVMSLLESKDPMAENIFGISQALLLQLAGTARRKLLPLIMTGIPVWSLRLATPDFKAVLDTSDNGDAGLRSLLSTFSKSFA